MEISFEDALIIFQRIRLIFNICVWWSPPTIKTTIQHNWLIASFRSMAMVSRTCWVKNALKHTIKKNNKAIFRPWISEEILCCWPLEQTLSVRIWKENLTTSLHLNQKQLRKLIISYYIGLYLICFNLSPPYPANNIGVHPAFLAHTNSHLDLWFCLGIDSCSIIFEIDLILSTASETILTSSFSCVCDPCQM